MFKILEKTLRAGIVTTAYPKAAADLSASSRGAPEFDFANWQDAAPAPPKSAPPGIAIQDGRTTVTRGLRPLHFLRRVRRAGEAPSGAYFELDSPRAREDLVAPSTLR